MNKPYLTIEKKGPEFSQLKAFANQPCPKELRDDRENYLSDSLHQANDGIIQEVLAAGSQVLIIGQNKLWKKGSNMGEAQNRRFHLLSHALLIELVLVKSEQSSILALCVEES